jgi:antitoxin component YwqK of YwqJK toxin-antitoxin module
MAGAWKAWYENGQLESDINFTTGKTTHFYKNATKQSEGGIAPGMISTGKLIGYYENGKKNYEGTYTMDGKKDGIWTWYDEAGKVTTQTYSKGELVK